MNYKGLLIIRYRVEKAEALSEKSFLHSATTRYWRLPFLSGVQKEKFPPILYEHPNVTFVCLQQHLLR